MGQSPLAIKKYFLQSLNFHLKTGFEFGQVAAAPETVMPNVQVSVQYAQDPQEPLEWRVVLDIKGGTDVEPFPYTFDAAFAGFFRVADNYPLEQRVLLVQVNAPSILYAAAREFLSIVTARSPYPPILLGSVSFVPDPPSDTTKPVAAKKAKPKITKKPALKKPVNKAKK